MGRPKIGTEYKKPSDYTYDYPDQRVVAKHLSWEDKEIIAKKTGYTIRYVRCWCAGNRKNVAIEKMAVLLASINVDKFRQINQSTDPSTN
jgi:hypothetical protein